jgi:hypothetical protein
MQGLQTAGIRNATVRHDGSNDDELFTNTLPRKAAQKPHFRNWLHRHILVS